MCRSVEAQANAAADECSAQQNSDFAPQYVVLTSIWPNDLKSKETDTAPSVAEQSMMPMYVPLKDNDDVKNFLPGLHDQEPSEYWQSFSHEKLGRFDMVSMYGQCAPPPGLEILPPQMGTVTNTFVPKGRTTRRRRRTENQNPVAGTYVGVRNKDCSRDECQATSRKSGECYQICHCRIVEVLEDDYVRVQYIDHERSDEVLPWSALQKTNDKDMKWCEHGRICNRMVRSGKCDKHHDELTGKRPFCHNFGCAGKACSAKDDNSASSCSPCE